MRQPPRYGILLPARRRLKQPLLGILITFRAISAPCIPEPNLAIHGLNTPIEYSSDFLISAKLEAYIADTEPNISPSAIQYTGGFTLNKSTNLRSRILQKQHKEWSPLNEAVYTLAMSARTCGLPRLCIIRKIPATKRPEHRIYRAEEIGGSTINLNLANSPRASISHSGQIHLLQASISLLSRNKTPSRQNTAQDAISPANTPAH